MTARPIPLAALLEAAGLPTAVPADSGQDPTVVVTGVRHDSRAVRPGDLFCCVPGGTTDGHDHASAAVAAGAVALLVERPLRIAVPQVVVPGARPAMAAVATAFWGRPSERLDVVGVTGTNGKTTVATVLAHVLSTTGRPTTVIGTLTGARTTPEATELQELLAGAVEGGDRAVSMEVSSHALDQHRVDGTRFAATLFTNLSRDHLDYHGTMERYFAAKARLFDPAFGPLAVIDVDGPHGRLLADTTRQEQVVRVSLDAADVRAIGPARIRIGWRGTELDAAFGGRFNARNLLLVAETAVALGVDPSDVAAALATAGPVPGRFEPVDVGQPYGIVVDYAHTPDGLAAVLEAGRDAISSGARLIVVFGCGGDRDRTKRPAMGEIASRLADTVVLTSDNPRSEDPATILAEIRAGTTVPPALVEPDRHLAIHAACASARPGDLVVVAGKGHETTQTIGDRVLPFDDRAVAATVARTLLQEDQR